MLGCFLTQSRQAAKAQREERVARLLCNLGEEEAIRTRPKRRLEQDSLLGNSLVPFHSSSPPFIISEDVLSCCKRLLHAQVARATWATHYFCCHSCSVKFSLPTKHLRTSPPSAAVLAAVRPTHPPDTY